MTESTQLGKKELLANIDAGWNDFQNYLMSLTFEQVVAPSDPAGWTPKDHIVHLAIWEDSLNALLDREPRWQRMGVPQDLFAQEDWDAVNDVIQKRYHDIGLRDLQQMFFGIHETLIGKLNALSEDDLRRPYNEYQPDTPYDLPISHWFVIDTYEHYDEHKDYIDVIVKGSENPTLSKDDLLAMMENGWNRLNAFLSDYRDAQLTVPTDAAGWSAKDHIAHLARWEDGIWALLNKQSRIDQMSVPKAVWDSHDVDEINDVMYQQDKSLTLAQAQERLREVHDRLVETIESLSDADLQRPYGDYDPDADPNDPDKRPVILWISGNTYDHYSEHKPWIRALIAEGEKARLLVAIQQGWDDLNAFLSGYTETQLTVLTDAAGWSAKDHIAHLARWEDGIWALLNKQSRIDQMGVPEDVWDRKDINEINAVLYEQDKALTLAQAQQLLREVHDRLVAKIETLSDADLQRPYKDYQPTSDSEHPVVKVIIGDTYEHYSEHTPWIKAIVEEK